MQRLTAYEQSIVFSKVREQLLHNPNQVTRQRAPLKNKDGTATEYWKLRAGNPRVYYYVVDKPEAEVWVVGVGRKEGEKVRIDTELIEMDDLIAWLKEQS